MDQVTRKYDRMVPAGHNLFTWVKKKQGYTFIVGS